VHLSTQEIIFEKKVCFANNFKSKIVQLVNPVHSDPMTSKRKEGDCPTVMPPQCIAWCKHVVHVVCVYAHMVSVYVCVCGGVHA